MRKITKLLENKKYLIVLSLIVPLSLLLMTRQTQPPEYHVSSVLRGPLRSEVSDYGLTKFKSVYTVSAPTTGWISNALVSIGDQVFEQKTPLFLISGASPPLLDSRTKATLEAQAASALSNVRQIKANVRKLRLNLSHAEEELERNESVFGSGAISVHTLENVRAQARTLREELRAAEAGLAAAQHLHEAAKAALAPGNMKHMESRELFSQRNGVVTWIYDDKEGLVTIGKPLLDIAQPGDLSFEIDLLARDALQVQPRMKVRFSDFAFSGRVRSISPTALPKVSPLGIDEQRTRVWIDFESELDPGFPAGLELEAHIELAKVEQALKVPSTAIWTEEGKSFVFLVRESTLYKANVTTGLQSLTETEIRKGLSEGDTVIRLPTDQMQSGSKVKILSL